MDDTRDVRVVIDSRTRNTATYPSPSSYEVDLPEDVFIAHSMRLLCASVPFSGYTIPPGSAQQVTVYGGSGGSTAVRARLPVGDYDSGAVIASELTDALDSASASIGAGQTFSIVYDERRDTFDLRSTAAFSIRGSDFAGKTSTARLLGFGASSSSTTSSVFDDDGSGFPNLIASPYRRLVDPYPYLVMRVVVPNAENINSPLPAAHRSFAIIPRASPIVNVGDYPFKVQWRPPISRVSRIKVEFFDPDGAAYDFQNHDHRLDLLFQVAPHRLV